MKLSDLIREFMLHQTALARAKEEAGKPKLTERGRKLQEFLMAGEPFQCRTPNAVKLVSLLIEEDISWTTPHWTMSGVVYLPLKVTVASSCPIVNTFQVTSSIVVSPPLSMSMTGSFYYCGIPTHVAEFRIATEAEVLTFATELEKANTGVWLRENHAKTFAEELTRFDTAASAKAAIARTDSLMAPRRTRSINTRKGDKV